MLQRSLASVLFVTRAFLPYWLTGKDAFVT